MHASSTPDDRPASRRLSLSVFALSVGIVFFAVSLTPSLIPRPPLVQGVLGGSVLAIGYVLARLAESLWRFMEVVPRNSGGARMASRACLAFAVIAAGYGLWHATDWQNSIRAAVGMDALEQYSVLIILAVALPVFAVLFLAGTLVQSIFNRLRGWLHRFVPPKVANVAGLLLTLYLGWALIDGFIIQRVFEAADRIYAAGAQVFEPDQEAPVSPLLSAGPGSLVSWQDLGNRGRLFIDNAPTATAISEHTGRPAQDPVRIYVGLNSAPTAAERTELAFAEMLRTGAFDRKLLVIAVPVGTGWLDDGSHVPLEFMHDGDVATVAVQYSYLTSSISLLFQYQAGVVQTRSLFDRVYSHWRAMPVDERPAFYVHGISQGAYLGMTALNAYQIIGDPPDGTFFAGPPFGSNIWRGLTAGRDPGTPFILPVRDGGAIARFHNQNGAAPGTDADWSDVRIAFLQYASDPIVFFDSLSAFRRPVWMTEERGYDVSARVRWYPVVTTFQLAVDMILSLAIAPGHGHFYIAEDYIPVWAAMTEPEGWTDKDTERLIDRFRNYQAW